LSGRFILWQIIHRIAVKHSSKIVPRLFTYLFEIDYTLGIE